MHNLNGARHLVFMRSWGKAVLAHSLRLCIGMDLMTVAFGASILEGGRLTFVLFDPLAAAVIGRSLERRVGVSMDDAQRGFGIFSFLDNTLCTDGWPGELSDKRWKTICPSIFYVYYPRRESLISEKAADIPLHDSLFKC